MTEQEWLNIFSDNLREIMNERGYNQKDLAEDSGMSDMAISHYIRKERIPGIRAIINIAYTLDCDINELIDFGDRIEG